MAYIDNSCMTSIIDYLESEKLPYNPKEVGKLRKKEAWYYLFQKGLYKGGYIRPSLKCVTDQSAG